MRSSPALFVVLPPGEGLGVGEGELDVTQHWTSDGPPQYPGIGFPLQLPVVWQVPVPLGVVHVEVQHCISAAPGQYPGVVVPLQSDLLKQAPLLPFGRVQAGVAKTLPSDSSYAA